MSSNLPFMVLTKIIVAVIGLSTGTVPLGIATTAESEQQGNRIVLEVFNYSYVENFIWEEVEEAFEWENPSIDLQILNYYDEEYHIQLQGRIEAGDAPDIMYVWNSTRSSYVHDVNILENLAEIFNYDIFENSSIIDRDVNGERWFIPLYLPQSTSILYANDKLLAELGLEHPKTIDDLKAMMKIADKNGLQIIAMANNSEWVMNTCLFSTLLGRYAGPGWIQRLLNDEVRFTDPGFVSALEALDELYRSGVISPKSLNIGYGEVVDIFNTEQALFFIDGFWRSSSIYLDADQYSMINFPAMKDEQYPNAASFTNSAGFGINSELDDQTKEAALTFFNFLTQPDTAVTLYERSDIIPAVRDALLSTDHGDSEIQRAKIELYRSMQPTDLIDSYLPTYLNDALNIGLQKIGYNEISPIELAEQLDDIYIQGMY